MYREDLFAGQAALVTGAGRGIGAEIATTLAELGADVAVNDIHRDTAEETVAAVEESGQTAVPVIGDVSDPDAVDEIMESAEEALGPLQLAVNNAGANDDDDLVDLAYEEWRKTTGINLDGTFLVGRAVARRLIDTDLTGSIVNVASITGLGPQPGAGAYSPSKAAIIRLTEQMALEWAEEDIRVNAIAPGLIWTPATDNVYSDDDLFERRRQWVPMQRIGDPADVARTAVYLLAPENDYTTGETAVVDAGASKVGVSEIPGRAQHE